MLDIQISPSASHYSYVPLQYTTSFCQHPIERLVSAEAEEAVEATANAEKRIKDFIIVGFRPYQ